MRWIAFVLGVVWIAIGGVLPAQAETLSVASSCGPGQVADAAGNCVPVPCPAGQTPNAAGQCEAPPPCAAGVERDAFGRPCTPPSPCPPGQITHGGQCIPSMPCPEGFSGINGCDPEPCQQGSTKDTKGQCVPVPPCANNKDCQPCPEGSSRNAKGLCAVPARGKKQRLSALSRPPADACAAPRLSRMA